MIKIMVFYDLPNKKKQRLHVAFFCLMAKSQCFVFIRLLRRKFGHIEGKRMRKVERLSACYTFA